MRLVLHTAAYWLMLTVRDAIPRPRDLATAEFATLRLRLLKVAARVIETTSRVRLAFAAACPRGRAVPLAAERALALRGMSDGADAPSPASPLKRVLDQCKQSSKHRAMTLASIKDRPANDPVMNRSG